MKLDSAHLTGRSALITSLGYLSDRVESISDVDLQALTPRHGWTAAELVVAVHIDLQRLLRNLLMTSSTPVVHAGEDRCSYQPGEAAHQLLPTPQEHARFVRAVTSAYPSSTALRADFASTVDAVSVALLLLEEGYVIAEASRVCTADFLHAWSQLLAAHLAEFPLPGE